LPITKQLPKTITFIEIQKHSETKITYKMPNKKITRPAMKRENMTHNEKFI
jgi:hypothetical protein